MAQVFAGAGTKVAKLPGVQPELDKAARSILNRAKGLAARRADSGAYLRSLNAMAVPGKKGVTDRIVYSSDPGSIPIEFGHVSKSGQWVPGQRILLRALYG